MVVKTILSVPWKSKRAMKNRKPICLNSKGGRNGIPGLQPSLKDRVYSTDGVSCAITTSEFFMPCYLVRDKEVKGKNNEN